MNIPSSGDLYLTATRGIGIGRDGRSAVNGSSRKGRRGEPSKGALVGGREASAVVRVISCQCLMKVNQGAHLGIAGVVEGADGEDTVMSGKGRGRGPKPT